VRTSALQKLRTGELDIRLFLETCGAAHLATLCVRRQGQWLRSPAGCCPASRTDWCNASRTVCCKTMLRSCALYWTPVNCSASEALQFRQAAADKGSDHKHQATTAIGGDCFQEKRSNYDAFSPARRRIEKRTDTVLLNSWTCSAHPAMLPVPRLQADTRPACLPADAAARGQTPSIGPAAQALGCTPKTSSRAASNLGSTPAARLEPGTAGLLLLHHSCWTATPVEEAQCTLPPLHPTAPHKTQPDGCSAAAAH
jgi:hypothetical protein